MKYSAPFFLIISLLLLSCGKSTQPNLVGTWKIKGGTSVSYKSSFDKDYYEFRADSSFTEFEDMSFAGSADLTKTGVFKLRMEKGSYFLVLKYTSAGPSQTWKIVKHSSSTLDLESYAGFTLLLERKNK